MSTGLPSPKLMYLLGLGGSPGPEPPVCNSPLRCFSNSAALPRACKSKPEDGQSAKNKGITPLYTAPAPLSG